MAAATEHFTKALADVELGLSKAGHDRWILSRSGQGLVGHATAAIRWNTQIVRLSCSR